MSNFYHIAILVHDIDAAIDQYSKVYGVTFPVPLYVSAFRMDERAGTQSPFNCRLTYSREGPMRIELFEAQGTGLWAAAKAARGVHHVGSWSADPQKEADRMIAAGCQWEATLQLEADTTGIVFVSYQGTLIELVHDRMRVQLTSWLEG